MKSVLGSIPIFHMSIFKVPSKIIHELEAIRGHFFNGHEIGSRKASWVKWDTVLVDKDRGGLGVSSLFALNRSLMFKWIWRFYSQKNSLWESVIQAIYGIDGNVSMKNKFRMNSCWSSIVKEMRLMANRGMDIFAFINRRLGNGEDTNFWTDSWYSGGVLKDLYPRLFALENVKQVSVCSKLADLTLESSLRRTVRGVLS